VPADPPPTPPVTASTLHTLFTSIEHADHTHHRTTRLRRHLRQIAATAAALTALGGSYLATCHILGQTPASATTAAATITGISAALLTASSHAARHYNNHTRTRTQPAIDTITHLINTLHNRDRWQPNSSSDLEQLDHLLADITADTRPGRHDDDLRHVAHRETLFRYGPALWSPPRQHHPPHHQHTAHTAITATDINNIRTFARWWPLSAHAANNLPYTWVPHVALYLCGATNSTTAYTQLTRTASERLAAAEQTHGADVLTLAQQLATDDPELRHTFDNLIDTAAALTPTPAAAPHPTASPDS
jgi:hypothetical protein